MAQTIEDVNSRTLLQQFHELYNKQNETETDVENIDAKIDKETIDRQTADLSINSEIQALRDQIDSLGVLFTYKGEVATIQDLPLTDNVPGDVYYVDSDQSEYIWLEKSGVYQWEQFGPAIDLSEYAKQEDLEQLENEVDAMNTQVESNASNIVSLTNSKQDKLTAGTNITIDSNNVISASGGGSSNAVTLDTTEQTFAGTKVLKYGSSDYLRFQSTNTANLGRVDIQAGSNGGIEFIENSKNTLKIDGRGIFTYKRYNSSYIINLPTQAGTIALTSDIPVYGCSIEVTNASGVTFLACINGRWTEYNTTISLSNCSEIKINNAGGHFDQTTGFVNVDFDFDHPENHIFVKNNSATVTILAGAGGGN